MGKAEYIKSNAAGNKLLLEPANKRGRGHKKCPPSAKKKNVLPKDQLALMDSLINYSKLANRK